MLSQVITDIPGEQSSVLTGNRAIPYICRIVNTFYNQPT
jgi:hypothetical protein